MTLTQQIITIAMCALATLLTRFLPFVIFRADRPTPKFVQYLGKALPGGDLCDAGGVLPAQCQHLYRKSRYSGAACHRRDGGTAPVEAANAAVHRGRHDLLYDFGTDGVCCIKIIRQLRMFLNWRICHI